MARKVTELTERDVKQAVAKWVDEGCPDWDSDVDRRVVITVVPALRVTVSD